jgi:putative ABC transport system ATP-binding protein
MITVRDVSRHYRQGENVVAALNRVSLTIPEGDFVAVTGESGSGKSTLLHLLGGLDRADEGDIQVGRLSLRNASEREMTKYRSRQLGIIFQFFNLLPMLNVRENVALPLELQGKPQSEVNKRTAEVLEMVGMLNRANHFAHELSGGEMQRTAVARALVHRPSLVLADEPTGNLDSENAAKILELFERIHEQRLATLIVVTHSAEVAACARRIVRLHDGRVEEETVNAHL